MTILSLFAIGAVARSNAYYGRGPGPILISRAQCGGSESSLQQCPHNTITHCTHSNDAGVTCPGKSSNKALV